MTRQTARMGTRVHRSAAKLSAALVGLGVAGPVLASPPSGSVNNRLIFADEFNGTSLDTTKWSAASPSWAMPNSISTDTAADVTEGNGYLTLAANRTSVSAFDSGAISTYGKYNFTGGYIEARIQLPSTPGSWPAFWGLYSGWPPEADIMEYPLTTNNGTSGLLATQYNTNFHYATSTGNAAGAGVVNAGSSLAGTWHTFGMDWISSTSVAFYLDGNYVNSYTGSSVAQMASMYTLLDYAVGGWPGTPSTSQWAVGHSDQTNVDWVRIWQADPNADAATAWNVNGSGSFTTAGNWTVATPAYENQVAVFGRVGTATTAQISLSAWQLFGGITFNGSSGGTTAYTIGTSANNIQLASTTSASVLASVSSTVSQTINANVELWSNTTFENDMTGGETLAVNGQLTGTGSLTAGGVGTTILSGSNNYTGGTYIGYSAGAGVLEVTNAAALSSGTLTFDLTGNGSTARLELAGGITVSNNILLAGRNNTSVAIENLSGNNTLSGTISATSGGGTYQIQSDPGGMLTLSGATSGGVAFQASSGSRTFTLQGAGNGIVTGTIQNGGGTVSISKAGTGTWTLSGNSAYTGTTTVTAGTLVVSNLSATSAINVSSGAIFSTRGAISTTGLLSSSGTLDLASDAVIANLSASSLNLSNATLNLKLGNGTASDRIVSTGAATVTGTNIVNLLAAGGQSISSGSTYTILTATSGLSAANFTLGAKPASLNFMQFMLSTPTSGVLDATATGNATPTTAYWTGAGSTATSDTANKWGDGASVNTSNWSTDAAGAVDPKQLPGSITNVIFNAADAPATSSTSATQLDAAYAVNGLTFNVGASAVTSASLNTNGYALAVGTGGVALAAASNASATLTGTGTIQLISSQAWANQNNTLPLTIASGVTTTTGPATLTVNGTGTGGVAFTGVLADGGGALSTYFNQAGTTTLSAVNTYTGTTTVAGGTVEITSSGDVAGNVNVTGGTLRLTDSPAAIAGTATVSLGSAATLDVRSASAGTAATANLGALTGTGTVTRSTAGATTLTIGRSGLSSAFAGSIQNGSGTVALVKAGSGTLTLSGTSSYTGGTTISDNGGIVLVTSPNALGTGSVTIGQGGTNQTGELQLAGGIALGGAPTIYLSSRSTSNADGSAEIENLSGANTISANLNINNSGGTAANILSTSGTLTLTGRLSSIGLTTPCGFDFYGSANGIVNGPVLNGTGQTTFVQKDGTGSWTLAGANSYTDGTTVNGGMFTVTGNNTWGGGSLTVNDGTAVLSGINTFTGGTIITGTSTQTGGSTSTGGRVVMAGTAALGATGSSITLSGNGTLEIDTAGGDNLYVLHVGTTNTVNLVSGVSNGSTGINHSFSTLFIGNSDLLNITEAANVSSGSPSITVNAVTLSSGYGAGMATFNPTTATLSLGSVTTTTAGTKTVDLDGINTGNAITGNITNGASTVAVLKSNASSWTLSAANSYSGGTTIDDGGGTLLVTSGSALGTGAVTIGNGGSNASGELALSGGIAVSSIPSIAIAGRNVPSSGGTATIENVSGNNSISAPITLNNAGGSVVNILSTAGTLSLSGNLTTGTVTGSRGFNFYGAGNTVVSGAISNGSAIGFVQMTGTGTLKLIGNNTYTGPTTVSSGTLLVSSSTALPLNSTLNISTGALTQITSHGTGADYEPQLAALNNSGTVDLLNNALLIHNGSIGTLTTEVSAGYSNGSWNGTNGAIVSSLAATDNSHLTAVGIATGFTTFGGSTVSPSDVLLKYTYYGDATLDGKVDGSDYSRIDNGYLQNLTGWDNGDFNYDGVINGSDYTLIDNAFNTQGALLSDTIADPTDEIAGGATDSSAVPEPSMLALFAAGAIGFLARRQRMHRRTIPANQV